MELIQNTQRPVEHTETSLSFQDVLQRVITKWYWFAASLIVCFVVAGIYILATPPIYTRTASLLIKSNGKGQTASDAVGVLGNIDIFQTNTNVNNELVALQSPSVMYDVVNRLHLDVDYATEGNFYRQVLYGQNLPYKVTFLDLDDNETASFTIRPMKNREVRLTDFVHNGQEKNEVSEVRVIMNVPVSTPIGRIVITRVSSPAKGDAMPIYVSRVTPHDATVAYLSRLTVGLQSEETTIVDLSFQDVNTQRAEDVLNTLIAVYNENWVKDKNQIAVGTSMFINERLGVIEQELGHVDENISSYKSANLLPDVQAASSLYMSQSSETSSKILDLNTQLSMARYIRNYMTASGNRGQLLPANTGLQGGNVEQQIGEYNAMQLQRNNLVANSSEKNPLVTDMDQSLSALHGAIISSIDNLIVSLNTQIASLERSEQQTTARIAANPSQAKHLLSVERQQKVKEQLYLFLLQKREENELSQAFTAYNTRVITPPNGSMVPTAPVKTSIIMIALAVGLAIPMLGIVLSVAMNTTVRGRKDLESLSVPFIGEIPQQGKKRRLSKRNHIQKKPIVVEEKSRDIINEAFRSVRTNLEFMTGNTSGAKIIMVTSFNPGSGKTFVAINLATCLAIKQKKVLVIDLDLRRATLSQYAKQVKPGISNYLAGQVLTIQDITTDEEDRHSSLDIIPVGTIPPNPTELLASERLEQLLAQLRKEYDYILIDCPPIEIVADATIISKYVDATLFVVRAGILQRNMLPQLNKLYNSHKYKNMTVLLNGTELVHGRRYGYQYGYNYGYGRYDK